MNYHFIAKLFDIKISTSLSRGKIIDDKARISNGTMNYKRFFEDDFFIKSIGFLEANAFANSTYVYEVGEYNDLKKVFEKPYYPTAYLNYLIRKVQIFLNALWLVKDNSVNLELGFLYIYSNNSPHLRGVHSNSGTSSPTNCYGEYEESVFTMDELELAIKYNNIIQSENWDEKELSAGRLPLRNPLTKENGRVGRAFYFLMLARSESVLPLKIMNFCSILECLFTSDSSEVTHKVSERFARFMGKNLNERISYFKLVKDLYKIRSKAVHGQIVRETPEQMKELLKEIDNNIREIFVGYFTREEKYKVFNLNNEEYEKWFNELILK
ncbi:hypothetical protein V1499_11210 [Neobacillus sp. SCS-31]|uniref:hypothetical protein n=1 Tax=Neobacillus oceani TaxID=3115292 RepID=UPI003905F69F